MDSSREQMFTSVEKTTHGTNKQRVLILALVVGVGTFAIGILIGRFATCPKSEPEVSKQSSLPNVIDLLGRDEDASIISEVIDEISSENIRDHVRTLAKYPHIAGMETSHELARMLKGFWENAGLDHVTLTPYNVLLSYPNMSDLNFVALLDENNNTVYKSNLTEAILTAEENTTNVVPPFNAFSYPGDIKGDIVYVNYGREEDFEYIEKNASISVAGKIVMARYGKIFRGDKVRLSEMRGAIGVILFSDPADYTNGDINQVYPNDWWLPPSGAQRGTVYIGVGDPLTADYPAIGTANRKLDPSNYLPRIPVHPIGYGIAIHLMRSLSGPEVNVTWRGLMNTTYRFGGGFKTTGWKARIHVSTSNGRVDVFNAIGIMRGEIEPDRYVLVGNHRDAWVFGAVDPGSGTAVMMEMSRVLGNLVKSGRWRPRRSILFCSWGAEEYGLVGSTEWVEHYTKTLGARAIAYLNLDVVVQGNFSLLARGTPMIHNSLFAATKMVPNPNSAEFAAGRKSVYDTWLMASPGKRGIPSVLLPGSGSDYAPFRDRLGVPVLDIRFTWPKNVKTSSYPMYHSAYETFYLVDQIMDKGFKLHKAIGQILVHMTRHLADSLIIPFDVTNYSAVLQELVSEFLGRFNGSLSTQHMRGELLREAADNFTKTATSFSESIQQANLTNPYVVRRINDQLMQLDRAFLDSAGLPGRRLKRHILLAESIVDNYAGSSFPGLSDALVQIQKGHNVTEQWEIVRQHYSVILFTIQSAASTLKDVTDFMVDYY